MNNLLFSLLMSFFGGGILCLLAQILIDKTKLTPAKILVLYVCLGVFIFSVGLFEPLMNIFGRGITVPLIGFGANIGKGVKEAIEKEGFLGILTGGITAAAGGITLSLFLGLLFSLIFKTNHRKM